MPSKVHLCTHHLRRILPRYQLPFLLLKHASTAASSPSTQPPSHRAPEYLKSQLIRQYTSLLRSSPLLLFFQHSNLKALEWTAVRRELTQALCAADELSSSLIPVGNKIKLTVIQTRIFEYALLIVEHFRPDTLPSTSAKKEPYYSHDLSRTAYEAVSGRKRDHPLHPLMCGPLAVLSFPVVSILHLKAALSILSPKAPLFAAPSRRANPGYYEPTVQAGLQKILLLGARVEGKVFDVDETRWVAGIADGMEGLRAQLIEILGSFGTGVRGVLELTGRSLYYTLEGRKGVLEEDGWTDSKLLEEGTEDTEQSGIEK